jgi:serine/threonine-protein kinase
VTTPPRRLGRYEILGHLAEGGMAEIQLARLDGPMGFEQVVVLKRILPHLRTQEFVDMFADEANIVAAIRHQNVVRVHELGREGDELYMVLEYLEGESAGSLLRRASVRDKRLSPRLAAHVVAEACAGLHAAHELVDDAGVSRGLVHRDVSPHNLFLTYDGGVKVLDFGIAKARHRHTETEAGQLKGKFAYMSPEQCYGKPLDRRSDVFSAGIVLYELSTGCRLFQRASDLETLKAVTEEPLTPPSRVVEGYPAELERIVMRALERKKNARQETAAELRRQLTAFVGSQSSERLPEEELSALMRELFHERIAEKKELLRRAKSGSDVTHVPRAEVDEAVEIPLLASDRTLAPTRATFSSGVSESKPKSRARALVVVAALIPTAAALTWLVSQPRDIVPEPARPAQVTIASGVFPRFAAPSTSTEPEATPLPSSSQARLPVAQPRALPKATARPRATPEAPPPVPSATTKDRGYTKL